MTAEEFYYSKTYSKSSELDFEDIEILMIEFAKYHTEQALLAASGDAYVGYYDREINKDSILNSYPLKNIK